MDCRIKYKTSNFIWMINSMHTRGGTSFHIFDLHWSLSILYAWKRAKLKFVNRFMAMNTLDYNKALRVDVHIESVNKHTAVYIVLLRWIITTTCKFCFPLLFSIITWCAHSGEYAPALAQPFRMGKNKTKFHLIISNLYIGFAMRRSLFCIYDKTSEKTGSRRWRYIECM